MASKFQEFKKEFEKMPPEKQKEVIADLQRKHQKVERPPGRTPEVKPKFSLPGNTLHK